VEWAVGVELADRFVAETDLHGPSGERLEGKSWPRVAVRESPGLRGRPAVAEQVPPVPCESRRGMHRSLSSPERIRPNFCSKGIRSRGRESQEVCRGEFIGLRSAGGAQSGSTRRGF